MPNSELVLKTFSLSWRHFKGLIKVSPNIVCEITRFRMVTLFKVWWLRLLEGCACLDLWVQIRYFKAFDKRYLVENGTAI